MIVRVLTGRVTPGREGAFNVTVRERLPSLRTVPGLVYVKFARQMLPEGERILLMTEWRDVQALYAWTGPDISAPGFVEPLELLNEYDISHWESLDVDPEHAPWPFAEAADEAG